MNYPKEMYLCMNFKFFRENVKFVFFSECSQKGGSSKGSCAAGYIFAIISISYFSLLDNPPNYLGSWVRYPKEIFFLLISII